MARYADAVRASPHNLLSPRGLGELETRHIPEALALAELLPGGPALVDVGSGAGLPGMVIALARPDLDVTLVESTGKKARFLERAAADLDLGVVVVNARIEADRSLAGRFDLATARAVAPLDRLVEWVVPVLRPGGRLYAVKGERWRSELGAAGAALRDVGAEVVATPPDARAFTASVEPPLRTVIIARSA
ncbi:MAG: 16S rRNA (guanine(527)-N(7))-methyltransferase RsmG [Actinomycetota bacterium]|nr:16S rRNA (guanine(527)-N(7))-methyltransferase RsmG [Actinomycetota bacterium]